MRKIIWSIKDIVGIIRERQKNKFDANILVSGDRGNGKSTFIAKLLYAFGNYRPKKHQVYSREEVIKLLSSQKYGICFDDEAINSGYKRDFQNKGQQELIKIVTAYRDNFNVYASAIPNFFSLDKDLRDLIFLHIHVIERGIGIVHMPVQGRLYSPDRWDAKNNAKVETSWGKKMARNPKYRVPYSDLSTFRGYLYFRDLTQKQREVYEKVKVEKRQKSFEKYVLGKKEQKNFIDKVYDLILQRKISVEGLKQICQLEGKRYETVRTRLRERLRGETNISESLANLLTTEKEKKLIESNTEIDSLVPEFD